MSAALIPWLSLAHMSRVILNKSVYDTQMCHLSGVLPSTDLRASQDTLKLTDSRKTHLNMISGLDELSF